MMKPNDKAIEAAATSLFGSHDVEKKWVEEALIAAYAAQFQSEEYAGLVKDLREDVLQFNLKDTVYENVAKDSADAIEALLAERDALNFELAARKEWPQARAEMLEELAKVRAERDALAARLAPVDDDALVEIAAKSDADFDGRPFAGLGRADKERYLLRARAAIAATRPHIEAAERERCAKIAETPELWLTDKPSRGCDDIAAAIRRGK